MRKLNPVIKKRFILALVLFLFIPQVYVISDCWTKGPCTYDYKFNVTFLILWKLLPSLFSDIFVMFAFILAIILSLIIAFFISAFIIREKRKF